jgi:hypothetical protein
LLAANARAQLEGTLFTEPEERAYLDYLRGEFLRNNAEGDFDIEEADIPEIPEAVVATAETGPVEYSFGGAMARRDGVRIWLNGNLLAESELPEGFRLIESGSNIALQIAQDGKTFVLLPGQTVDVTAGTVVENFQRPAPTAETATAPAAEEPAAETDGAAPEAAASQPVEAAAASVAATTTQGEVAEVDASANPVATAIDALDDDEVDTLFEALETRRLARTQPEDTADEEPDNQAP